ncbi:hypothetical protein EC957_008890 [Mortierella hygrophila]|uniref:Protein kinase domain-containing protein n=1 Tax=Mortierella hygrophila TaxID=979708 RepID=A0A9P6EX59_9FUNG|nr:hypothetical protein EC957_008890 [Mortierella hygrophila]
MSLQDTLCHTRYRDWKEKKTYDVVRPIAAGGYGSVLKVQLDGKLYALKVCDVDDPNKKDSYDREAKALKRTNNCHIIKLHAAFQERRHLCLALELANKSLEDVLRQTKRLPLDDAKHYARGIAAGLDYLHQRSIVHRDIKPNNVLLFGVDSREVKLADFGLALRLDGKKKSTRQGTTEKAFFEQVLHKNPNVRFDIQQARAHAFLQVDQNGEEQSTEDNIGSSLSKRPPEAILEEREEKRARQDAPHPREEERDEVARTVAHASTLPKFITTKTTTSKADKPVHSQ